MDKNTYMGISQNKLLNHSSKKYILIIGNWVLQGLWYSDKTERAFKILIDLILTLLFFFVLISYINTIMSIIIAFIIAHTLNWLFNHHFWALVQEVLKVGKNSPKEIIYYAKGIKDRASNKGSILCAAVYGSLCRGELSESSDLDVRIVRKPGIINGVHACLFGFLENIRAFLYKFPLDMHVVDSTKHLSKLRDDEVPVVLHDPNGILEKLYTQVTYFKEFFKEEIASQRI